MEKIAVPGARFGRAAGGGLLTAKGLFHGD
jgi:hypothetical protein